jgi:VEFS-Box of polycomb protein
MLGTSDRMFSKPFIGDISFDLYRERTRFPLFLNRNMKRVLDRHENQRNGAGIRSSPRTRLSRVSAAQAELGPPPRSTRLRDQLIEKFHQEDAELIFDVRSIRRKLNYKKNLDERPRKRQRRSAVDCRCYLAVWDNREGHRQLEPILKRSEDCTITPSDASTDAHAVDIELESTFRVPAKELFVPFVNKDGEVTKWAIGDKYLLEIKIIPCNSSDLWPPMPILAKSEDSLTRDLVRKRDLAFTEGMLISNYTSLPHAPPADVPLNVAFDRTGRTFKTKYGLEVNAEWTYPHVYEAKIKKEQKQLFAQMDEEEKEDPLCRSRSNGKSTMNRASRPKDPVNTSLEAELNVSYIWDIETRRPTSTESRTTSLEGLYCPICHLHEFRNLRRLQFHLLNNHDKYRFSIESEKHDPQSKELKSVIFRVETAEAVRRRAANDVKDEREFTWHRPEESFDIDSYISGEHSWVGDLPRRRTGGFTASSQAQMSAYSSSAAVSTPATSRKDRFRPASEVPEIPLPVRKRFPVPVAKTRQKRSFYRSVNHRAMETGELLSETDDDIDDDWLVKRQHDTIADTQELNDEQKSFWQKWNAHLMDEGMPSSRYISDSLVRFVRKNRMWLKGEEGKMGGLVQFQELVGILIERRVLDARVVKDCFEMIERGEEQKESGLVDRASATLVKETPQESELNGLIDLQQQSLPIASLGGHQPLNGRENGEIETQTNGITHSHPYDPSSFASPRRRNNTTNQETESDVPTLNLPPAQSEAPPSTTSGQSVAYGFCGICTQYIARPKRNSITCSNLVCRNRGIFYHLSCCGLKVRERGFRCKECEMKLDLSTK